MQTWGTAERDAFIYEYRYDGRGRLVEKKLPGKGWEYMVYDKADRLVMTQDANMRPSGNWLFTRYDKFSRPVYTGTAFVGASYTREQVQASVNYLIDQGQPSVEARNQTGFTNSGMSVYYGNTVYPTTVDKILTVNYYDTYPSYTFNPAFPADIQGAALLTEVPSADGRSTKGLPVMSLVKNIEDDNWTKNYTYYDTKGRAVGGYSINHLGGYTRTESQLDFTGVPLKSVTKHKRLDTDTEKVITENFEYDPQNRLLVHKHQVDSNPEEILAQNTYNELSQLKIKKVGGTVPTSALQTIDYQYNIRGWMTQINNPADLGADLFGYKINYNQVEGLETPNSDFLDLKVKPRYNGNIAEVSWKTLTQENEPLKRYGYSYDSLNRLSAGFYQKAGNETAKEYFEKLDYDLNGNIKRLQRSEGLLSGSTTAIAIDNLRYDYTGNKLTKITDEQQNPSGYPYLVTPNAIGYDNDNVEGNGNMISNLDKGISSIQYNYLNLPKQIIQNSTVTNITYRADGVKVKKLFGDLETDYLDGFQYKSTKPSESGTGGGWVIDDPNEVAVMKLKIIPTAEGYYDSSNNQYVYNFTDHLGNIRLSYTDTNKDGIIQPRQYHVQQCEGAWNPPFELPICIDYWKPGEIVEVNNYYPFGLLHNYTMTTQNAYQYKYNGKELQETGMYDYGARMYMPDIGRWGVQDPLSELYYSYSPYSYTINNPIRFIDPNGMWIDIKDGDMTYRYNEGKLYTQNGKTKKWDIEANVGNDSYAGKILSSLNSISGEDKNSFGNTFLGLFANDNINTTIQPSKGTNFEGQNGTYIDGSGIVTDFDQEVKPYTSMNGERTKQVQSPFYMTLFHEIGHSFFNQTSSRSELGKAWVDGNNNGLPKDISQGEIAASYIENLLRSEQGLPIRISYSPDANYSSTLVDAKSIKWQPTLRYNGPGNSQINTNSRIFTMPTSAQAIYNKIMNSKK
jgi:RHS repeat-associated protein